MTSDPPSTVSLAVSTVIFALRATGEDGRLELWVPLVRRIRDPFRGAWALPGGPLHPDEELEEAAARSLRLTTGLRPSHLEQLATFGGLRRSAPSDRRTVSVVYWAALRTDQPDQGHGDLNVSWMRVDDAPPLAFDHSMILEHARTRLRTRIEHSPVAFSFLPELFTLAQLREVHEAVLGTELDPANFRRTVLASKAVEDSGLRLEGTPHRPPQLFRALQEGQTSPGTTG